jgi:uncharacterized protein (TIGR00369 family)
MERLEFETILGAGAAGRLFGFRLVKRTREAVQLALPLRPEFLQGHAVVHGGILATLADSAAVIALFPRADEGDTSRGLSSIEFKLNFLRPALLESGEVLARAQVVQRGRRLGVCDVELDQAGKLVAKGLFTYMYLDTPPVA